MANDDDSEITLSYLHLTGDADTTFPICVLTEMADAHGIDYDIKHLTNSEYYYSLIEKLNGTQVTKIVKENGNFPRESYPYIARFVNKDCSKWTSRTLLPAFEFILSFKERKDFSDIREDVRFGNPTPEDPCSISSILAFVICKNKGITGTDSKTTRDKLNFAAKLAMFPLEKFKSEFVHHALALYSPAELITSLVKSKENEKLESKK